jgi:hypothetical protein
LWYQLCFSLLPGLTADGRENRLELRPDLRAEGLTHLLSSPAARTALGSEVRGARRRPSGALGRQAAPCAGCLSAAALAAPAAGGSVSPPIKFLSQRCGIAAPPPCVTSMQHSAAAPAAHQQLRARRWRALHWGGLCVGLKKDAAPQNTKPSNNDKQHERRAMWKTLLKSLQN